MISRHIRRIAWMLASLLLMLPAGAADDAVSLAAAIREANDLGSGAITLDNDITLTQALPAITGELTIDGAGHSISGGGEFRIFDVTGGSLVIRDLVLTAGRSPEAEGGGAIRLRDGSRLTAERASLTANRARHGGAILAMGGSVDISDSVFDNNCGLSASHTLIDADAKESDAYRSDADGCDFVTFRRRSTDSQTPSGLDGGAILLTGAASASITRTTFSDNRATNGGAISIGGSDASLRIDGSRFLFNQASSSGGAIGSPWTGGGGATSVSGSSFVSNVAENGGGAIAAVNNRLDIRNSTFSHNQSDMGGGAVDADDKSLLAITHASFVDNISRFGPEAINSQAASATLRNSLISSRDDSVTDQDCAAVWRDNSGNLSVDGTCAELPSDELLLGQRTGAPAHYPLLDFSPAVDAADPDFCLDSDQIGTARPQGAGCDIGAIESRAALPAPLPIEPPPPCPLALQIIAANNDAPAGGCPAGRGHDVITLTRDITLAEPLPRITSQITIDGGGHSISGDRRYRIFVVAGGILTVKNLTLKDSRGHPEDGGAIRLQNNGRARVMDSRFIGNQAEYGGAVFIGWTGASNSWLTVENSHFADNGNSAIYAGSGRVSVSNSSFVDNWGRAGAGIGMVNPIRLEASNSSFIRNTPYAIGLDNGVGATLTHLTLYGSAINLAASVHASPSRVSLRNSVIAGSAFAQCDKLQQNVGNFIENGACGSALSGDAMLEEPSDTAQFLSPLPGSPLIRAARPNFCPESDQIGNARSISGRCNIGAIEAVPVARRLADCRVTPTHVLNLRDGPEGGIIGGVRQGISLPVLARTPGWFHIEQEDGTGWISADYVVADGACA